MPRVELAEAALITTGIALEQAADASSNPVEADVEAPGTVMSDPARNALVSPRAAGRLETVRAVVGDRVTKGQLLAEVQSAAFVAAQVDFLNAQRRARLLDATPDSSGGRALAEAARQRLGVYGLSRGEQEQLEQRGAPLPLLPVRAPFSGSLMDAGVLAGAAVEAGSAIFRIVDLREVDIIADVPERQLPLLRRGQRASVRLAAYPDVTIEGVVERIVDELNPVTRTIRAVVHAGNARGILRPGMFATVVLHVAPTVPKQARTGAVTIPASAVLTEGILRYAFVAVGARTFERRTLQLGQHEVALGTDSRRLVRVLSGIAPGEQVVVKGAFTLKSELAKAAFAEDE
jgi:RND family efflux transporter MFP subunit